jgi:hypothetical protein
MSFTDGWAVNNERKRQCRILVFFLRYGAQYCHILTVVV